MSIWQDGCASASKQQAHQQASSRRSNGAATGQQARPTVPEVPHCMAHFACERFQDSMNKALWYTRMHCMSRSKERQPCARQQGRPPQRGKHANRRQPNNVRVPNSGLMDERDETNERWPYQPLCEVLCEAPQVRQQRVTSGCKHACSGRVPRKAKYIATFSPK